ncbi:bifunctional 1-(5-phosphoribosyl)-5-((5-phosphoribosylamino)methylideneamino)imidazole-4-carboxamide isomerase/phosphoribosylanthranilate isomerase PriA [Schaalia odontolytica]|uniref:1-(5-phosphoribosyl)-5-[(5-phosphoribosylamino)methylideneamino] imidazole-4-carboxamide isomerase n=1 Tax=Schaalia odontolytica TaxID=1660 RepID=A0A0V8RRG3_9ACTO|nr:HisA/HisF-related TIM barrel protein [Schaalia odontolytica]KSW10601.1 1-(5-phosphoribosyl)-5-[(5-phosphoribosylamino)methylideneamino] imidazole-4-carboxamide isomerase [Schaalia odontolytica]QCT35684.1 bifunctional 1-(5-phosphoribosyl)-5-((5-phosphoribosylamino)methylideneamino)imidazole-4-carboxamide isomerase/phosphoribosylanthranilate isomerase PriA [Schaalia odontolytica]
MTILELLPAIDVTGGQAVRLSSGSIDEGSWGSPLDVARSFDEAGARWVHLVDLDLAFGRGEHSEMLARVIREVPVRVELSGGITSRASIETGLAMGPERVNIATQALDDIDAVGEAVDAFGERVAVCLDVRGDRLAARGGSGEGGNVWEALRVLNEAGVARLVVTDVTRDGQMNGSNRELLARVADRTPARIIASGGVNSLADIEALRALGIEGAIVGKALYQGAFTLADALDVAGYEELS